MIFDRDYVLERTNARQSKNSHIVIEYCHEYHTFASFTFEIIGFFLSIDVMSSKAIAYSYFSHRHCLGYRLFAHRFRISSIQRIWKISLSIEIHHMQTIATWHHGWQRKVKSNEIDDYVCINRRCSISGPPKEKNKAKGKWFSNWKMCGLPHKKPAVIYYCALVAHIQ